MKDMIKKMVEEIVAQSIKEVMAEMMGVSNTPEVAPAEVAAPKPNTMSREDFLALAMEDTPKSVPVEIDFVVFGSRTAKYTGYVPSDVWTVNHLAITKNYGAKWSKKNGGYVFETPTELRNFLASYHIKTDLDDTDRHNIKVYKAERAKARAEYYAKKAAEIK